MEVVNLRKARLGCKGWKALAHPPLGINLFIAQSYFRRSIMEVTISAIPFLLLLLGVVAAVTYWEPLALMLTKSG